MTTFTILHLYTDSHEAVFLIEQGIDRRRQVWLRDLDLERAASDATAAITKEEKKVSKTFPFYLLLLSWRNAFNFLQVSIAEQGSRASAAFPFPVAGEAEAAFTVEVARPAREGRGEGKGRERQALEVSLEESCCVSNF